MYRQRYKFTESIFIHKFMQRGNLIDNLESHVHLISMLILALTFPKINLNCIAYEEGNDT